MRQECANLNPSHPQVILFLDTCVLLATSGSATGAAVLLTLDRTDFHGAQGREIYGMRIRTPADFLIEQRKAGLI